MTLNERANAGADAETLLAEVCELNPDTPAWGKQPRGTGIGGIERG